MSTTGARKAAMLLRNLDPSTAAELLQSAGPEMLTEIAVEVAALEQSGVETGRASQESVLEFFSLLHGQRSASTGGGFARQMLQIALGEQESQEVISQVDERLKMLDPFRKIRSAEADAIAEALAGESAQAASVVLSELPASKSAKLLGLLGEATRAQAVACMTGVQEVSPTAKLRIAGVVQSRLEQVSKDQATGNGSGNSAGQSRQRLRKVAVLLRGLDVELRNQMVESLTAQDGETAQGVQELMVIAERGHYPAVDILRSISRLMHAVDTPEHQLAARKFKAIYSTYQNAEDLINIGALAPGSNHRIDKAISLIDRVNDFLIQPTGRRSGFAETVQRLCEMTKSWDSLLPDADDSAADGSGGAAA